MNSLDFRENISSQLSFTSTLYHLNRRTRAELQHDQFPSNGQTHPSGADNCRRRNVSILPRNVAEIQRAKIERAIFYHTHRSKVQASFDSIANKPEFFDARLLNRPNTPFDAA